MLLNIDIPVFIINLKKDIEKKDYMSELCKDKNIQATFIKAINGNYLNEEVISKVYSKELALKYMGRELTKGEIGTALSHLSIYEMVINRDIPIALILEDDIECNITKSELDIIISNLPSDWELVLLGHHPKYSSSVDAAASIWSEKKISKKLKCIRFSEEVFGAYGYLINKNGAKKSIDFFSTIDRPIDHWNENSINLYGIKPSVIKPNRYFLEFSSLTRERNKLGKFACRTLLQRNKDRIRFMLEYLKLLRLFFRIKSFVSRFKVLRNYK